MYCELIGDKYSLRRLFIHECQNISTCAGCKEIIKSYEGHLKETLPLVKLEKFFFFPL